MNILKIFILAILTFLIRLQVTEQFLKKIASSKGIKNIFKIENDMMNFFKLSAGLESNENFEDDDEDKLIRRELFSKGLKLWRKFFVNTEAWEIIEIYPSANEISRCFVEGSKKKLLQLLNTETWRLTTLPMIPDVIAKKIIDFPVIPEEIKEFVNFFMERQMYCQFASFIVLHDPPIVPDNLRNYKIVQLTKTLEYIFALNPNTLEQLFEQNGNDIYFLIAPLIACNDQIPEMVRDIIIKTIQSKSKDALKNDVIVQICIGIMLTEVTPENADRVYLRNEKLIKYLHEILEPFKILNMAMLLKACHVMNMIKHDPENVQAIISEIYLDDSEENIKNMFKLFLIIAPHFQPDFYHETIKNYKMVNFIDEIKINN